MASSISPVVNAQITAMVQKGTIPTSFARIPRLFSMLTSQTFTDFLTDYPDYKLKEKAVIPFQTPSSTPGVEDLLACIHTQWVRHFLKTGKASPDNVPPISSKITTEAKDQIPRLFHALFNRNSAMFLKADLAEQQVMALTLNQLLPAFCRRYSFPDEIEDLVLEFEDLSLQERLSNIGAIILYAKECLNARQAPSESKTEEHTV